MTLKADAAAVPLRGRATGAVILVDADVAEVLADKAVFLGSHGYATFSHKGKPTLVHRFVMDCHPGDGLIVDHVNHLTFDNRRSNLRVVSRALNNQNRWNDPERGVFWRANRWEARAKAFGKSYYLGRYADKEEAVRVAHEWRLANMPGYVPIPHPEDDQEG